jgi:FMN phosphatase YigB (HAD superfamily)
MRGHIPASCPRLARASTSLRLARSLSLASREDADGRGESAFTRVFDALRHAMTSKQNTSRGDPMNDHAFDALLFDLGGVVLDIDLGRVFARWAEITSSDVALLQKRFAPDDTFLRHETGQVADDAFFERLRTLLGVAISDAELLDGWNAIFIGEMPGIAGVLATAAARLPLYAFSNTNRPHQLYFSKRFADALSHFRQIFTSSDIGLRKPDAEAFQFVIDAIGVPAGRILFFDDSLANVEGARACGLQAVHVTSRSTVSGALARMIEDEEL